MQLFNQNINGIIIFLSICCYGFGQTNGCMDNGYQLWSPVYGSPACNYDINAEADDGSCYYPDCTGDCEGNEVLDECGVCQGNNLPNTGTCDCAGIPNGSAHINPFCVDDCVGGDTGLSDCVSLIFPDTLIALDEITEFQIYAENIDTLKSLEIEFYYKNIFEINEFSIYDTDLHDFYPYKYILEHYSEEIVSDTMKTTFIMYFNPSSSADTMFYSRDKTNIFNIKMHVLPDVSKDSTQLIINSLAINENSMNSDNWSPEVIWVDGATSCKDESACNLDALGECLYEDCNEECGGTASLDPNCGICVGGNTGNVPCAQDCDGIWCNSGDSDCLHDQGIFECIGGTISADYTDQSACIIAGGAWVNIGNDACGICGGDNSSCIDCNNYPNGSAYTDVCGICVGGETERDPCTEDCHGDWGGIDGYENTGDEAYYDGCSNCVGGGTNETDCLNASINIIDTQGIQIQDNVSQLLDIIIVALHMENLPDSIEGLDFKIEFNPNIISFNDWGISSEELDSNLSITGIFENYDNYNFEVSLENVENASIFIASIFLTSDAISLNNSGNVLFLKFFQNAAFQDSTLLNTYTELSYYSIQINEHEILDVNSTSLSLEIINLSINYNDIFPTSYFLSQNYPNPFNPMTSIEYFVPYYDDINIDIINIRGRAIKNLIDISHQPGNYQVIWNGTNNDGFSAPAGIYFYQMKATDFITVKKLILLK